MEEKGTQYRVTGMTCAACSAHVEKAVKGVKGVESVAVSLLTNSMQVTGTASEKAICDAVKKAGYSASLPGKAEEKSQETGSETKGLVTRLLVSLCFLLPLMYLSMGHMMWHFPLPAFLEGHGANGLAQLILAGIVMVINRKFFVNGTAGLLRGAPNMDTLVSLGAGAAFLYSTAVLFSVVNTGEGGHFYFESAGMILTLITLGKLLESRSKGKTTDALKQLMQLAPKTAVLLDKDGKEHTVEIAAVKAGDRFVIRSGDSIPTDGEILEGSLSVDESALTGESLPVDKEAGHTVSAATVCKSGYAVCRATRVGEDTTLSQIIRMVSDAAATKAPIAKLADKVSGIFVPAVLAIAAVTVGVWMLCGKDVGFALARGISVLVISCPCALGLATPVAIMVGNGKGAKNGILFKTAAALEGAGRVEIVALDKTGTLTKGTPGVTDVLPMEGFTEEDLLTLANALEQKSEHPLAKAIVAYCGERHVPVGDTKKFKVHPGNGVSAMVEYSVCAAGNAAMMAEYAVMTEEALALADKLAEEGKTPLFFGCDGDLVGILALADTLKEDAVEAVKQLKGMGVRVVMLTGDHQKTADAIGRQAGVDTVYAGLLPGDKEEKLRHLAAEGKVAMVGDGINDAPALTRADLGIAIGAGTDVAIEAADVVLVRSHMADLPAAVRLGRRVLTNIRENLFWAFFYNAVGIPLAAGVWIPLFGWELEPMFGAAAMSLSSFCVVTNALRLNFGSLYDPKHDHKRKPKKGKAKKTACCEVVLPAEKTISIEGMMCGHCEGRVRTALEGLEGVEVLEVSNLKGIARVKVSPAVTDGALRTAVEKAGYTAETIS
ncbi:MAG: heavy metal translocating P-type ATPase [Clostridia bacterium]|nr:heavy metal translocating P-type ATPase [Clostridia bacterium]